MKTTNSIWEHWPAKILIPSLLTVVLFALVIYGFIIPHFHDTIMERKKETIRNLTLTAWSVIENYRRMEREGILTAEEAKKTAAEHIKNMRYGSDMKDYYWINDMDCKMIVHPYLPHLEGSDLSDFKDKEGNKLFLNFVKTVESSGEGYVSYYWQWLDHPDNSRQKLSYVKGFEPWGWIVGTGLYLDDVRGEINQLTQQVIILSSAVLITILFLSFIIINQGVKSERSKSEAYKQLFENEMKYRALFESAYDAIILFENKTVQDCNPRTLELFECAKEDILNNPISMLWPKTQRGDINSLKTAEDIITKVFEGKPQSFEWQYQKFNGEIIETEVSLSPIDLSGRKIILAIVRDITQRKQAEEDIKKLNEELEDRVERRTIELTKTNFSLQKTVEQLKETQAQLVESEKMAALGGLVAGISHEINTPVGIGVTAASHLKDQTEMTIEVFNAGSIRKSQLENYFTIAQESSQLILSNLMRADELIKSFKQVAVDQSSEKIRTINFKDYLYEILKSMQHKFKKTNHIISIECPDNFEIRSYPGAYYQIFTNLFLNSLIHGFEKIERGKIEIEVTYDNDTIYICYRDNGIGISSHNIKKIFEPFFTTKGGMGGSGLGLHIVYNIVTRTLKGTISCKSEINEGVVFQIYIPIDIENS